MFSVNLDPAVRLPWIIQLVYVTPIVDGTQGVRLAPPDASLPRHADLPGRPSVRTLTNQYKNWSEGLQLTIQ